MCRRETLFSCLFVLIVATTVSSSPVGLTIAPQRAAIATGQTLHFSASQRGHELVGIEWSTSAGSIDARGNFTAPTGTQSTTVIITARHKYYPGRSANAIVNVVAPGQVLPTANPQVALYTVSPAAPGDVSVQFGTDTSYGLTTWTQPVPAGGGSVSMLVAGMKAATPYHLQGIVQFADGTRFLDADQIFTTAAPPAMQLPIITAATTVGMTPQNGIELLDLISNPGMATMAVADLAGDVLWTYTAAFPETNPNPIKLLPNGHFLINFSGGPVDGQNSVLQEVDLAGELIWQMTADDLNNTLANATCTGCNITVVGTHHDFAALPNGHLILIAALQKDISGTKVTGDVLIDLDQNRKPVWVWNEFDHLDTNRRPMSFPDWTHTNAILYSKDDGNLLVSLRHQNWIIKVDYKDGAGTGDIVWKLGYQGDFTLVGGSDPTDWFYAQHDPSFASKHTSGRFSLVMFDNGYDRVFSSGITCGATGEPSCSYSTVPQLELDETARTATLEFHLPTPAFSDWGGNAEMLKNHNVEYCESAVSDIYEVTPTSRPQTVWTMHVTGQYIYRGQRLPSLYPGVQW